MAITFEVETEKVKQPWRTITSLDIKLLKDCDTYRQSEPHYYNQITFKERLSGIQLHHYYKNNELYMDTVKKHCENAYASMIKSILFVFTTPDGVVLSLTGPQELIRSLDQQHNLGEGSVFTVQHAGLNAISFSMQMKDWVYVSGAEHDFNVVKDCDCFCSPVRENGEVIGYLGMSFSMEEDHLLMAALFSMTLKYIEEELEKQSSSSSKAVVYDRFQQYRLSPREKEIGYLWMNNYSALRIASELGLTEGTVRNVIKNVYRKAEVSDKGQFIRKFLIGMMNSYVLMIV